MCRDKGLLIVFTLRIVESRTSSWMDLNRGWSFKNIAPIVRAVPDAKCLIVNVATSTALNEEEIALIRKAKLLMDSSRKQMVDWPDLFKRFGTGKFCLDTRSPILDNCTGLLRIETLRENESDGKTKNHFRAGNLKRMLGA